MQRTTLATGLLAAGAAGIASLDFMVMGDWGGIPHSPYTTLGEVGIAKALGELAGSVGAKYTLTLGDNFYDSGIKSVTDARFKETFEDVFTSPNLQNQDHFRVVAGNHDHLGDCDAEIAYTAKSPRWHFPGYYYDFVETAPNGAHVHHVMIDTVVLSGGSADPETLEELRGSEYPGPLDVEVAETQWDWINKTLATSTADYLVVGGHYPVWSICEHGPTSVLVTRLKPMLEAYHVTAYVNGHDHCAQFFDEGKGVQYHGIGAGILVDSSTAHKSAVPAGSLKWHWDVSSSAGKKEGAFGHVSITDAGFQVAHYSSSGKQLFQAPVVPPRKSAGGEAREAALQV